MHDSLPFGINFGTFTKYHCILGSNGWWLDISNSGTSMNKKLEHKAIIIMRQEFRCLEIQLKTKARDSKWCYSHYKLLKLSQFPHSHPHHLSQSPSLPPLLLPTQWGDPTPRTCLLLVYNGQCDGKFVNATCIRQQAKMRKPRILWRFRQRTKVIETMLRKRHNIRHVHLFACRRIHVTFTNVPSHCSL